MKKGLFLLACILLSCVSCSNPDNPLVPSSSLFAFLDKWGKDDSNPDNYIGPGHGDGSSGSETGAFKNPTHLALSAGTLLVLDAGNHRIQKFGLNGSIVPFSDQGTATMNSLGSEGAVAGKFSMPSDLKTDPAGRIFVPDANNFNVQIFGSSGTQLQMIAIMKAGLPVGTNVPGGFMKPVAVCVDDDANLYVLDQMKGTIDKFTNSIPNTWTIVPAWGSSGSLANQLFFRGVGMARSDSRIIVLMPDGFVSVGLTTQSVTSKPLFGYSLNRLSSANGIKTTENRIYVTEGSTIKCFDACFNLVTTLGGIAGSRNGEFLSPRDALAVGETLYVADSGNHRLQLFKMKGMF